MKIIVREETILDIPHVFKINEEAFSQPNEAILVDKLRDTDAVLSLVVEIDDQIAGHIMFSLTPIIDKKGKVHRAISLAPVAVSAKYQGKGIGGKLINTGLKLLITKSEKIVILLGHAEYYPRFGFEQAMPYGILPPFEIKNPKVWMVKFLDESSKGKVKGTVRYPQVFNEV